MTSSWWPWRRPDSDDNPFDGLTPVQQIEKLTRKVVSRWRPDSTRWIHELGDAASRYELDLNVIRPCALELARLARVNDHIMPTEADWRLYEKVDRPFKARLVLTYVHAHRLRLELRFQALATIIKRATATIDLAQDSLVRSLEAFAELGLRAPRADGILQRVPGMPNYDRWCRAACLHGIGIADHLPDQAGRLLRLCDEMSQNGEEDADVHYWRAFALRRSGDLEQAQRSIDRAIEELPAARRATSDAYLLERQLIQIYRDLGAQAATLADRAGEQFQRQELRLEEQFAEHRDDLKKEVQQQTSVARQIVPDSLRTMAIALGLGAVLIAFLVTTVALALGADNPWLRTLWVGVILLGGLGLVALMWWTAGPDLRRRGLPRATNPLRLRGFKRSDDETP